MHIVRLAGILGLTAAAIGGYAAFRGYRPRSGAAAKPEPLQRWEGEGGSVPGVEPPGTQAAPSDAPAGGPAH